MSYKIIALMLVLLVAGAMTATAKYEISVKYDDYLQLQSATFPGSEAPIAAVQKENQKFPAGQLVKTVTLGEIISSSTSVLGGKTTEAVCTRHINCHDYPCKCPCGEGCYDGDGNFCGELDLLTGKHTMGNPLPLSSDNVGGVKDVTPLGELMIFKLSDGTIIRCISQGSKIIISPPSKE